MNLASLSAILVIATFLFFMGTAAGETELLEVSVEEAEITTQINNFVTYYLLVTNKHSYPMDYLVKVRGVHLEWYMTSALLIRLEPSASQTIPINFYPTSEDVGTFSYDVIIESRLDPKITQTKTLKLNIVPSLIMDNFAVLKEGNELDFEMQLDTSNRQMVDFIIEIRDNKNAVVASTYFTKELVDKHNITGRIIMPQNPPAGEYISTVKIAPKTFGKEIEIKRNFIVEPIHNVVERSEKVSTPFYDIVTVYITNYGNIGESSYATTQRVPEDLMTAFLIKEPQECFDGIGEKECRYVIASLAPGETTAITYRVERWLTYLEMVILLAVVIAIASIGFFRATKPSVVKTISRKDKYTYGVMLEVKNPFFHNLGNVVVRDWISPIAEVIPEELHTLKPFIRKSPAGTEMIWKLGDIKPKEYRVVAYKLRKTMDGHVKLAKAHIRYTDKSGKPMTIFSKDNAAI